MSKPLPPAEAKLRADITKALGRAMALVDRAFHSTLYNRKRRALRQIGAVYDALMDAEGLLGVWIGPQPTQKKAKRRARQAE